ncbi:response regulator [Paenibacillus methanolicus]|uniref:Two-component system response regulator YesN n=1 Tax=Paenibacillus methanolicus TaxID=582686 RepID=A0A5S5C908_9BACL|nr:response regulator [Paenibacillus methanolicus]TYP74866.1 two-component system response regulator YesN [Paenibacillus methanolicus]
MYRAMLVDDDAPMLKYLNKLLPWKEMGVTVAATAQSGAKALERFKEETPQLVITDIGMPHMDGLELAAELRAIRPDVRIIFLTCHEDFQYARKAVQLDADDYLIKDELTADALRHSVEKSIRLIQAQHERASQLSYRDEVERNRDVLKQAFWKQVSGGDRSEVTLASGRRLGIDWGASHFMLGLVHIDFDSMLGSYGLKDAPLLHYALYNIAQEMARDLRGMTVFAEDGRELVLLLNYERNLAVNTEALFRRFAEELAAKAADYLRIALTICHGGETQGLGGLASAIRELRQFSRTRLYYERSGIAAIHRQPEGLAPQASAFEGEREKERLLQSFRVRDAADMLAIVDELAAKAEQARAARARVIAILAQWVRLIEAEAGYDRDNAAFLTELQHTIRLVETAHSVKTRLAGIMHAMPTETGAYAVDPKPKQIDRYIMEHLSENVSLVTMANHLYMNPSYFSRYFKKMTGVNFTDYVHRFKMNIALQMMRDKDATIEMISVQLGYSDRTYFSKVFKKYMGMSPGDFRGSGTRGV